jgi:hypothetical protein
MRGGELSRLVSFMRKERGRRADRFGAAATGRLRERGDASPRSLAVCALPLLQEFGPAAGAWPLRWAPAAMLLVLAGSAALLIARMRRRREAVPIRVN